MVGTATIGRPVVSAIAFARPVVEPPPTLTSASTLCVAAASRARAATSTGTCITTSSYRSTTRRFPVMPSAMFDLLLGRDHHDPAGAEGGDLVLEVGGGLAGAEADPLRKGVVNEAHAFYLPAVWQERPTERYAGHGLRITDLAAAQQ